MEFDGVKQNIWTFDPEEDDPIHVIVRGIEADVHAQGWDGRPRLGFVIGHKIKDPATGSEPEVFAACEIPMFSEFYNDPSEGLATWNSVLLRDMSAIEHLGSILEPVKKDFKGWIFVSETWFVEGGHEEVAEDTPRKESRVCVLCLRDGRIVQVARIRNTEGALDEIQVLDSLDEGTVPGGFVVWNLVTLVGLSEQVIKLFNGNFSGLF